MTKKKKNYFKNKLYIKGGLLRRPYYTNLLIKSFYLNMCVIPYSRTIFKSEQFFSYKFKTFSRLKLKCSVTTSKRVPNKKYLASRYYLNKYSDLLNTGFVLKK